MYSLKRQPNSSMMVKRNHEASSTCRSKHTKTLTFQSSNSNNNKMSTSVFKVKFVGICGRPPQIQTIEKVTSNYSKTNMYYE